MVDCFQVHTERIWARRISTGINSYARKGAEEIQWPVIFDE